MKKYKDGQLDILRNLLQIAIYDVWDDESKQDAVLMAALAYAERCTQNEQKEAAK